MNDKAFKVSLLNPYQKRSKVQTYLALVLGIAYLIIPIYKVLNHEFSLSTIIWIILAIIIISSGYLYTKIAKTYELSIDQDRISSKDSVFNKFHVQWSDVKKIRLKPVSIRIFASNKREKTIHLHNVEFSEVQRIKDEIQKIAESKAIHVEF